MQEWRRLWKDLRYCARPSPIMSGMRAMEHARRFVLISFVGLCALWYWKQNIVNVIPTPGLSDFRFYYYAAQHIVHGESPYLTVDYIYPPLLACALTPLAGFDYFTARWIWFVFSHICLLAAAFLLWRRLGRDWIAGSVVAFVWSVGWVAQDSFATGQPDPLLTLLIVVACVSGGVISGAAAGMGFALKLIPAALGLLAPLERSWRSCLAFLSSAVFFIAVPWVLVAFLRGPARPVNTGYLFGTPSVLSWSIPSVALRMMEPPAADGRLPNDWVNGTFRGCTYRRSKNLCRCPALSRPSPPASRCCCSKRGAGLARRKLPLLEPR